jgi:hypothetical protein
MGNWGLLRQHLEVCVISYLASDWASLRLPRASSNSSRSGSPAPPRRWTAPITTTASSSSLTRASRSSSARPASCRLRSSPRWRPPSPSASPSGASSTFWPTPSTQRAALCPIFTSILAVPEDDSGRGGRVAQFHIISTTSSSVSQSRYDIAHEELECLVVERDTFHQQKHVEADVDVRLKCVRNLGWRAGNRHLTGAFQWQL